MHVVCWKWGTKYGPEYVNRLKAGVARHLKADHSFVCITDDDTGLGCPTWPILRKDLIRVRDGCYARLQMFSPAWQERFGVGKLVCLDLDLIPVGDLDPLFTGDEPSFGIFHGGHFNPCPFNGSVMMIRRGAHPEVWTDFTVDEAEKVATADGTWRGSDQTWIAHKVPGAPGWTYADGVFAYEKPGWPKGDKLPADARIVAFPGKKDPSQLMHLDWVKRHWAA